jgi:hypothetical protein
MGKQDRVHVISLILKNYRDRSASFTYEAEYAALVHEESSLNTGRRYPARPWIEASYKQGELVKKLAEDLEQEIS